jgi:hypothetical protein
MKKFLLYISLILAHTQWGLVFATPDTTQPQNSPTCLIQAIQNHPNLYRTALIFLNALEFFALNKKIDLFGISCPNNKATLKNYLAHNLAKSFPTATNKGPLLDGTELRSLGIIGCLSTQNYFLAQLAHNPTTGEQKAHRALESTLLATGGGILAWIACLLHGTYKCVH